MVIYKITNTVNNKVYVGKRALSSEFFLRSNYWGSGKYIKKAIKKYGKEVFIREVICECISLKDMNEKEKYHITNLNSFSPRGYNIQKGGEGGNNGVKKRVFTKKWIDNIGKGRKGISAWNKGLKKGVNGKMENCGVVSKTRNQLVSKALKGKPKSKQHKLKMSGENCNRHKLTWKQVFEIRQLYSTGKYSQHKIAVMFNLNQSTISSIIRNETWNMYE